MGTVKYKILAEDLDTVLYFGDDLKRAIGMFTDYLTVDTTPTTVIEVICGESDFAPDVPIIEGRVSDKLRGVLFGVTMEEWLNAQPGHFGLYTVH